MSTLGGDLSREMLRVRDEVMPSYKVGGPGGVLSLAMMRRDLDRAAAALSNGSVREMSASYEALKEYTL